MSDTPTLPRPGIAEHEVRAWLTEGETSLLDALECDDLVLTGSVAVSLVERRGKRRSRQPLTDEQRTREKRASDLIGRRIQAHGRAVPHGALREIARLRREIHYARLGQEPPPIPESAGGAS